MPWRTGPVDERESMIRDRIRGLTIEELIERYNVGRSCVYKWLARYEATPTAPLVERSRRPQSSPGRTPDAVVERLLELKAKHQYYGPAKLVALLEQERGHPVLAASTAGEILSRNGLVRRRRARRHGPGRPERTDIVIGGPGETMTADYKGQFQLGNGRWCYPLTIADPASRFVWAIDGHPSPRTEHAMPVFERVFREVGVPSQILTDNGAPFASVASLGGLTALSKWWVKLGIDLLRITPGRPQQNGTHERFHGTIAERIADGRESSMRRQQRWFDEFREEFNHTRPHASLGQKPPASAKKAYCGVFAECEPNIEYGSIFTVRSVRPNGCMKWKGEMVFVSEVLAGEPIGLLPVDEAVHEIYFATRRIGYLDERTGKVSNARPSCKDAPAPGPVDVDDE